MCLKPHNRFLVFSISTGVTSKYMLVLIAEVKKIAVALDLSSFSPQLFFPHLIFPLPFKVHVKNGIVACI